MDFKKLEGSMDYPEGMSMVSSHPNAPYRDAPRMSNYARSGLVSDEARTERLRKILTKCRAEVCAELDRVNDTAAFDRADLVGGIDLAIEAIPEFARLEERAWRQS